MTLVTVHHAHFGFESVTVASERTCSGPVAFAVDSAGHFEFAPDFFQIEFPLEYPNPCFRRSVWRTVNLDSLSVAVAI